MIRVGTSGYYYKDWEGVFYPPYIAAKDRLKYYSTQFDCVEINSTYYRPPTLKMIEGMASQVPETFLFSVKAHGDMTHRRNATVEAYRDFAAALAPLIDRGQLVCVLAEFPTSFHNTPENVAYIKQFRERMGELETVIEFRTRDWLEENSLEDTLDLLQKLGLGYCCVDLPQFKTLPPPIAVATSKIGYVRFHGRNFNSWWQGGADERYHYRYTTEELNEWIPRIRGLEESCDVVCVLTNNHPKADAVDNGQQLRLMLNLKPPTQAVTRSLFPMTRDASSKSGPKY